MSPRTVARRTTGYSHVVEIAAACFVAGLAMGWWLRANGPLEPSMREMAAPSLEASASKIDGKVGSDAAPVATTGVAAVAPPPAALGDVPKGTDAIRELRQRNLRLPLDEVRVDSLKGDFDQRRSGAGGHQHEAADMLAPRNTPIHAVDEGTVVKLFLSKAGGQTIYQFDPSSRFCYYYAHLERYAPGLAEGQAIKRGDVIGYVGTSGNAPPRAPHLHFAVFVLGPQKHWWQGVAIDPYLLFK